MDADWTRVPLGAGAIAGAVAWPAGYLLTYLLAIDRIRNETTIQVLQLFVEEADDWILVGWAYYNAHAVDVVVPRVAVFEAARVNYVVSGDPAVRLFVLLPPIGLVLAGATVARIERDDDRTRAGAAIDGASITVGYLAVSVVGLTVFAVRLGDGVARPDPVGAVLVAGLAYPLVFGATGGVLAHVLVDGS